MSRLRTRRRGETVSAPGLPILSLLVCAGGILGTLARYAVSLVLEDQAGWPIATLSVNIFGAFALGVLLERLASRAPESSRGRDLRLFAGTGFLGSFTTYSSLAVEAERLLAGGSYGTSLGYLGVSVTGGLVAGVAGVLFASWWSGRRMVLG